MIIYGTNGAHVRTEPLVGATCPACATSGRMTGSVFSRYVHVYWVPLLPYSKPAVATCLHCQGAWELAELPAEAGAVQQALRQQKKATRAPWWQWSGLLVLLVAGIWAYTASVSDDRADADYLQAPRAGDVYTVRVSDSTYQYSLLKVVRTHGNTLDLVANEYSTDNDQPLLKLNYPEKYEKEEFTLTQLDLLLMQKKGQLTDVDRPGE